MSIQNKKIFLDTDIGDDIDDALALIELLKLNIDVVGVSTVFKNTDLRARLAKKIVKLMNKNTPVYKGYGQPFGWVADEKASFCQFEETLLEDQYKPDNQDPEEAIDAMIEACYKYGKDLVIVAIGPVTNLVKAIQKDRKAFEGIDKIVSMGGCWFEQFIEYNTVMDPEAFDVLMKSKLNVHYIGADVTWKVQLNDEQTRYVLNYHDNGINGYCADLVRMWKKNCWFNPVLHDPLAVYYALDESICTLKPVWSDVELVGPVTRGLTANRDHFFKYLEKPLEDKDRILVAEKVDAIRFNDFFVNLMFHE